MQDGTRKPTTVLYYSTMIFNRIVPHFSGEPLNDINELEIQDFLSGLRMGEKPLAEKTIKHYYITLSNTFQRRVRLKSDSLFCVLITRLS